MAFLTEPAFQNDFEKVEESPLRLQLAVLSSSYPSLFKMI